MVHGKAMSSLRLGTLAARPPPQPPQLALKHSTMEEPRPKEKWCSPWWWSAFFCNNFFVHCNKFLESFYKFSPIEAPEVKGWRAEYMNYESDRV